MKHFLILFKHEFRMQFPKKKKGIDIIGTALSLLITLLILGVFVYLLSTIVDNYINIKLYDPIRDMIIGNQKARTVELLNVIYTGIIVALTAMMLEKMRSTLARQQDKTLFLRLPVKQQTIFMSKMATLVLSNYITAFLLIVPINLIFYMTLRSGPMFWVYTACVWLLLPMISLLAASVLIVPYIKIVDFVSNKYIILFVLFTGALVGAFLVYAEVLEIVQSLLETGSIKFLFNDAFIETLQKLINITYPANCFAYMIVGKHLGVSFGLTGALALVSIFAVYFISKALYYITLYKNDVRKKTNRKKVALAKTSQLAALIRKEFIAVFREPQNLFSYFAIATAMPIMVYSCYTLFDSLVYNALGFKISFALALIVILIFSILTNTFCATNVSRDGELALKVKMFPVKASKLLLAKVLFCSIVSSLSVLGSTALLYIAKEVEIGQTDLIIIAVAGVMFSLSQIFFATRLDLNHAKVMASAQEIESESGKTISKTVFLGIILALLAGVSSLLVTVFANSELVKDYIPFALKPEYAYAFPLIVVVAYLVFSVVYYTLHIEKKYINLVR